MLAKLRARATFANVASALALFIALGGTAYAAVTVTGKNVKNGSLTGADVKNNSLTGADVKSLTTADFSGALPAGAQGPAGPQGPAGAKGADGAAGSNGTSGADGADGAPGVSGYEVETTTFADQSAAAMLQTVTASCQGGKKVLGGGWTSSTIGSYDVNPVAQFQNGPVTTEPQGWRATLAWDSNDDSDVTVFAICANVAP